VADDLTQRPTGADSAASPDVPPAQQEERATPPPPSARRVGVHVGRFRVVYAVLSLVVGAAVGGLIVLSGHAGSSGGPRWSAWEPNGSSAEQTQDIAAFVSREYRIGGNRPLVGVSVERPPTVPIQELPVKYMVLSSGSNSQNVIALPADDTVSYILCGGGESCAMAPSQPTPQRRRLLRREALELALYTFKYVSGIDSVVALLPPRTDTTSRFAAFFTRKGLEPALDSPLSSTLPTRGPLTPSSIGTSDTNVVRRYADPNVFQYSFGQAQDGGVFMQLQPPRVTSTQNP